MRDISLLKSNMEQLKNELDSLDSEIIEKQERRKTTFESWRGLREEHDAELINSWGDTPDLTMLLDPFASVVVNDFASKFFALNHLSTFGYWRNTRQRSFFIDPQTLAGDLDNVAAGIRTILPAQAANDEGYIKYGIRCPDTDSDDWFLFIAPETEKSKVVNVYANENCVFDSIDAALKYISTHLA